MNKNKILQSTLLTFAISVSGFLLVACKGTLEEQVAAEVAELEEVLDERLGRIDQISDPEMRNSFSYLADMMFFFDKTNAESVIPPANTVYTESRLDYLKDYENSTALVDAFINSIWVSGDDGFVTAEPKLAFAFPQRHSLVWQTVTLKDGSVVPLTDYSVIPNYDVTQYDFDGILAVDDGSVVRVYSSDNPDYRPLETQFPVEISGEFQTLSVEQTYTTSFEMGSVGETQTAGPFEITLKEINGHIVTVNIARTDGSMPNINTDNIYVEARDETGGYLDDRARSWGDQDQLKQLQKAFDSFIDKAVEGEIAETDADSLYELIAIESAAERNDFLTTTVEYRGQPTSVDVTILQNAEVETIVEVSLPVTYLDVFSENKVPTEVYIDLPVTDSEVERMLSSLPQEVTAEEIASLVTPIQSEYYSQVEFEYPKVQSSIFIDGFDRFTDEEDGASITFFDESGEPISVTDENEYDFTVNRIEYDQDLFPVKPDRVAGKIFVDRLISMTQETFMKDELPDGIRLDKNMILLDGSIFGSNEYKYRIFAIGENGQPLQNFTDSYIKNDDGNNVKVSYHYGDVAGIIILRRGESELVPYEFDIKIVPPKEY